MTQEENTIVSVLARHSGVPAENIKREIPLAELGLNSFKFMISLLEIQKTLGKQFLTVENLATLQTIDDLLAVAGGARPTMDASSQ